MGCCNSSPSMEDPPPPQNVHQNHGGSDSQITNFSFTDLNKATENFCLKNIVSENGGETSDIVYKGRFHNGGFIAVKKFTNMAWSDPNQFVVHFLCVKSFLMLRRLLIAFRGLDSGYSFVIFRRRHIELGS